MWRERVGGVAGVAADNCRDERVWRFTSEWEQRNACTNEYVSENTHTRMLDKYHAYVRVNAGWWQLLIRRMHTAAKTKTSVQRTQKQQQQMQQHGDKYQIAKDSSNDNSNNQPTTTIIFMKHNNPSDRQRRQSAVAPEWRHAPWNNKYKITKTRVGPTTGGIK